MWRFTPGQSPSSSYVLQDAEDGALGMYHQWLTDNSAYPVNVDEVKGLYSRKSTMKEAIQRNFRENVDYVLKPSQGDGRPGRPIEKIFLSIICFKELLMMQSSAQGKRVRRYFLLAEEVFRKNLLAEKDTLNQAVTRHQQYEDVIREMEEEERLAKPEAYYQHLLETLYTGFLLPRESSHGIMDIHLPDQIIEVKHWKSYKHALGQLLAYNQDKKKHLRVIFFGTSPEPIEQQRIESLFKLHDVGVSFFDVADNLVRVF